MHTLARQVTVVLLLGACRASTAATSDAPWYPERNAAGDPVAAVFESRVPCDGCERLKLALALYRRSGTGAASSYEMSRVRVGDGDLRTVNRGEWVEARGTALDANAPVVRLTSGYPEDIREFWAIGEDILFVLDRNRAPRVGTAAHSYALNRVR